MFEDSDVVGGNVGRGFAYTSSPVMTSLLLHSMPPSPIIPKEAQAGGSRTKNTAVSAPILFCS